MPEVIKKVYSDGCQVEEAKNCLLITLLFQLWVLLRQQEQRGHRETLQQL